MDLIEASGIGASRSGGAVGSGDRAGEHVEQRGCFLQPDRNAEEAFAHAKGLAFSGCQGTM